MAPRKGCALLLSARLYEIVSPRHHSSGPMRSRVLLRLPSVTTDPMPARLLRLLNSFLRRPFGDLGSGRSALGSARRATEGSVKS